MNGNVLKWWPVLVAIFAAAAAWGANNQRITTHIERPAHKDAQEAITGLKAASDRIDERTSRLLKNDERIEKDMREHRQLLQRILERMSQ